jgi:hypothetical protein
MVHFKEYVAGWLDSSIPDFLELLPRNSSSTAFALITCLDSDLNPATLLKNSPELRAALNGATPLKNGLLLPSRRLRDASVRNQIFFGFDEVWFFPTDMVEPKPDSAWIVGPNRIDQTNFHKLWHWMAENRCSLALGDGEGMNFIVKAHGLVKYLLAHSLLQPEPHLQLSELVKQDEP